MPRARNTENLALPLNWRLYHGAYYFRVPPKHKATLRRTEIRLGATREDADAEFERVREHMELGLAYKPGRRKLRIQRWMLDAAGFDAQRCGLTERQIIGMYSWARTGAKSAGRAFDITLREFVAIANRAGGQCELSGIPWQWNQGGKSKNRPWRPSLDRIDSRHDYSYANCRLVCCAVNIALSDFGEDVLRRIASGICGTIHASGTAAVPDRS